MRLTYAQATAVRERHAQGEKQVDLAGAYGTTQATVSRVIRGEVLTAPPKRKLTFEQVQTIRYRRLTEKVTLKALADAYGLTSTEVKGIVDGVSYKDVPPSEQEIALKREIARMTLTVTGKMK